MNILYIYYIYILYYVYYIGGYTVSVSRAQQRTLLGRAPAKQTPAKPTPVKPHSLYLFMCIQKFICLYSEILFLIPELFNIRFSGFQY